MTVWIETSLGQVAAIRYGKGLPSGRRREGRFPVFGSSGRLGWHESALVDRPGVIVGRKGDIGRVFYSPGPYWPIDTTFHLEPAGPDCDLRWLYYALQTMGLEGLNEDTACPGLNHDTFRSQPIRLPPIGRQKAAARLLGAIDDRLELVGRQNGTLADIIAAVHRGMFLGPGNPDWPLRPLSHFGSVVVGGTPPTGRRDFYGGPVPFIKIPDMRGNVFTSRTGDTLTETGLIKSKVVGPGSICVSCLGTVGLVSMTVERSQTNQQINTVVPFEEIHRHYLFCQLRSISGLLATLAGGSSVTPNLNTSAFAKIEIPSPDRRSLADFNRRTAPLFRRVGFNQKRGAVLESLRALLLPRLVDGTMGFSAGW